MNKISVATLRDAVYSELAILPVPTLERLFKVGRTESAEEVILAEVKSALTSFERYYPLKKTLKLPHVQCSVTDISDTTWATKFFSGPSSNFIKFYDNTEQVFYNLLDESDLQMVPLSVKRLQMNFGVSHPTDYRGFEYQKPILYGQGLANYGYYSGLFKYPVIVDKRESNVLDLNKAWVLFMYYGDDTYRTFKAALVCKFCDYILDLKDNFEIPGLPINMLNSVSRVRDRFDRLLQMEYGQAQVSWGWD